MTLGNDNGTDGQTDSRTDRQTDRQSATQYAAPPREEGRIKTDWINSNSSKCINYFQY